MCIPVKLLFGWTDFDAVFFVQVLNIARVPLSIFNFEISINYVTGDHITKKRKIVNTQKLLVRSLQNLVYKQFNVKSYLYVNKHYAKSSRRNRRSFYAIPLSLSYQQKKTCVQKKKISAPFLYKQAFFIILETAQFFF